MKAIRNIFYSLSLAILFVAGAAQAAPPPAWVLACSAGARRVALASFQDPSRFLSLVTDLRDPFNDRGSHRLSDIAFTIIDAGQNGARFCDGCAIFNKDRGDVREIQLANPNSNRRPLSDTDYKIHANLGAVALHAIRYPDANPSDTFESATIVSTYPQVVVHVRVRSNSWYSGAIYEVVLERDAQFPVRNVRVKDDHLSQQWPSIQDPSIRMAAAVSSQNVGMATMGRQRIARNVFSNINGLTGGGWGKFSAQVDILDATMGNGIPLGRAEVVVDSQTGFVEELKYRPAKTTPPRSPYQEADFRQFARDGALALYSARRPDIGNGYVQDVQFINSGGWSNEHVARVQIRDGESGSIMTFDVHMAKNQEYPITRVAVTR